MTRGQPQYLIEKTAKRGPYRKGDRIVYTGPRANKPKGWRIVCRVSSHVYQDSLTGLAY